MATVKHVVVDSGAFIQNAPIEKIGEKCYTLQDVCEEIRDRATRQRLQVLPYELIFREPSAEAIITVTEFAKKTGDYRSLSAVDIRVMALTYQLEKQFVGTEHIKAEPDKKVQWTATSRPLERATDIVGFYLKPKNAPSRTTSESETGTLRSDEVPEPSTIIVERIEETAENEITPDADLKGKNTELEERTDSNQTEAESTGTNTDKENDNKTQADTENEEDLDSKTRSKNIELCEGEVISEDCIEEGDSDDDGSEEEDEEEEEDDGDDDGWITPSNIKSMKEKMGGEDRTKAEVAVGCLTTDFAIQNVLIQMGLNVISVDGYLIKRAKSYVLRCFACMKITTNVQKRFCPHCGNQTLTKVSCTVNEDGTVRYYMSRRRPVYKRGTKFSLPTPKGGKHAANPTLFADQPRAHNRMSKKAHAKTDILNSDHVANMSPFALNDVTSRAAQLGITGRNEQTHYWDRRNPNEPRRKLGKRK